MQNRSDELIHPAAASVSPCETIPRVAAVRFVRDVAIAALGVLLPTANADAQETTRVSVDSSGVKGNDASGDATISADGQIVAFGSTASNLVAGDTNGISDIFVHDRSTGFTERASVDSSGAEGNGSSYSPSISADGRIVAFMSYARNLVAGDTNGVYDVFVYDRSTGLTERVSVDSSGAEGNGVSGDPAISADGQVVVFMSNASNLVSGDTNGKRDAFVHDRATGITERVSVDSSGAEGNRTSDSPAISADGRVVSFISNSTNLVAGDTNVAWDTFVHDRASGITQRVSVDSSGAEGNDASDSPAMSADGQIVAFRSYASNLVAGDVNGCPDVFVHDRSTGLTERVSVDSFGAEGNGSSGHFVVSQFITADGRIVAFVSDATNLVIGDTNGWSDVFVHDRLTGTTECVSVSSSREQENWLSENPTISADGLVVAFDSNSSNLVDSDTNGVWDVFVHDLCSTPASWSNYGAGFPGTNGVPAFTSQQNPVIGTTITLDLANSYGNPTVGLLFIGFQQTIIPTNWGGDLLVLPVLTIPITFSYGGDTFTGDIPDDPALCGVAVDLQAIESDPGAAKGVSFTPGLELVMGH